MFVFSLWYRWDLNLDFATLQVQIGFVFAGNQSLKVRFVRQPMIDGY